MRWPLVVRAARGVPEAQVVGVEVIQRSQGCIDCVGFYLAHGLGAGKVIAHGEVPRMRVAERVVVGLARCVREHGQTGGAGAARVVGEVG